VLLPAGSFAVQFTVVGPMAKLPPVRVPGEQLTLSVLAASSGSVALTL
jgi:hypothetical protein